MKHLYYHLFVALITSTMLAGLAITMATPAYAVSGTWPQQLHGWGWSPNIGWISFNSTDSGAGGGPYAVQINAPSPANPAWGNGSGNLTGYAWSPNIGWIQFGGLTGCPAGSCNARVNFATNQLEGWARAVAGTDVNNGGWDGWISLNCSNDGTCSQSNYHVNVTGSGSNAGFDSNSYAWGSTVVGWINFSLSTFTPPCPIVNKCLAGNVGYIQNNAWCQNYSHICGSANPVCSMASGQPACVATPASGTLTVTPASAKIGATVQVQWNAPGASGCYVLQDQSKIVTGSANGSQTSNAITNHTTTFQLYCSYGGTNKLVATQVVQSLPTIYEN